MKVKVIYNEGEESIKMEKDNKIEDVLDKAGINRETIIVKKNGKIVPPEEEVSNNDLLKCIRITSRG